jgi:hypothetical protein
MKAEPTAVALARMVRAYFLAREEAVLLNPAAPGDAKTARKNVLCTRLADAADEIEGAP